MRLTEAILLTVALHAHIRAGRGAGEQAELVRNCLDEATATLSDRTTRLLTELSAELYMESAA